MSDLCHREVLDNFDPFAGELDRDSHLYGTSQSGFLITQGNLAIIFV